jgi:succinyl-diaminopimelate desuccinylase
MGAQVVEIGVTNATIHKVNECIPIEEIEKLHRIYASVLRHLVG